MGTLSPASGPRRDETRRDAHLLGRRRSRSRSHSAAQHRLAPPPAESAEDAQLRFVPGNLATHSPPPGSRRGSAGEWTRLRGTATRAITPCRPSAHCNENNKREKKILGGGGNNYVYLHKRMRWEIWWRMNLIKVKYNFKLSDSYSISDVHKKKNVKKKL